MSSVQVSLLADLLLGGIPYGSGFLIEYDPDSAYYQVLESMVHDLLSAGHVVSFFDYTRFPDQVRRDLKELGSNTEALESQGKFRLYDGYTATLGVKSKEPLRLESLKVADLSLEFLKMTKDENPTKHDIGFSDNGSVALRYNEEKSFLEFYASRVLPRVKIHERISFSAFVNGVHSQFFYRSMEDVLDGIIDVKFDEKDTPHTKMRVRTFKLGPFDAGWMRVKFDGPHASLVKE